MNETTTETTTSAPADFAEAAAALEASSASTAETTTTAESTAPAAITQAADGVVPGAESVSTEHETKGEPPKWRWQDILANARETSAKEAEARLRQEYDAKVKAYEGIDPSDLQGYRVMQAALAGHPQAIAQVRQNPQAMQALRQMVAEQHAQAEQMPEPDLQAGDGTLVYSAQQMQKLREWDQRQMTQQFEAKLQPFQSIAQSMQQREQVAAYSATVGQVLATLKAEQPKFGEHLKDVREYLAANPELEAMAQDPRTANFAIRHAWYEVHNAKVLPAISQQSRASVLADIHAKTTASTVNPGHGTVSLPRRPRTFEEAATLMAEGR